ncbi:NAD(P)-binding protein [Mollisia scopiformis]|uniref:NAD(P)-binding protein n=1 Tax=Mollisia scopiformis TaxID=149040 RepID=A0A132B660_MOLSC|nr:NAD(P)-binding protein [Mollisia scopiformis]KUJ07895.1 NAD(P)-binding protein [Mollisia scopiformis]
MSQRILLTGANGFLGTHILAELLKAGFSVRSVVRSQSKADQLSRIFPTYASKMDFGIVPDMTIPGAFNQVVQANPPFTTVLHQASPFFFASISKNEDFLLPAIEGTTNLLKAVKEHAPEVKRVIYTSSCAAVLNFEAPIGTNPQKVYTDSDWNPVTYTQAIEGNKAIAYRASKKFAELAGWNFIQEEKPNFDFVSINPPMIYGPMHSPAATVAEINESNVRIYNNFINSTTDAELPPGGVHMYVDVRDLATAHVRAVTTKEAGSERIIVSSKAISSQEISDLLRSNFPELDKRTPVGKPGTISLPEGAYTVSNEKAKRMLGLTFRSDEECFVELGKQLLEIEKGSK